jgi:iron complex outermembrane receptor protein
MKKDGAIKGYQGLYQRSESFVITNYSGVDPEVRYIYGGIFLLSGVDARDTWVRTQGIHAGRKREILI